MTDSAALVVLDASAVINLNATGRAPEVVRALPNRMFAVDSVYAELQEGSARGRRDAEFLDDLVAEGLINIVTLGNKAETTFESLVMGRAAETLDDGEAATIAYAAEHDAVAIIDERKAIRICGQRFPTLRLGCTVDLFAHPNVLNAVGHESLSQAVLNALQLARMRVLPHHVEWVVALIGPDQAAQCVSLPRSVRRSSSAGWKS